MNDQQEDRDQGRNGQRDGALHRGFLHRSPGAIT
jgi:hypothetical protein